MAHKRTANELHDRVVKAIASQAVGHVAYVNLEGHPSASLIRGSREISPDVILCDQDTLIAQHVIEVETLDSLSPAQIPQWARADAAVHDRGHFWLLVPAAGYERAGALCRQSGIRARIGVWSLDPGGVTVSWEPAREPRAVLKGI